LTTFCIKWHAFHFETGFNTAYSSINCHTRILSPFPFTERYLFFYSIIVYHKTLHLYYKFSYYEERTYNLLRYHYHFIVTTRYISGAYHSDLPLFLPLYTTVIRYFAILYEVFSVNVKCLPSLINQALPPFSSPYFSSTTWKIKNLR